MVCNLPIDRSDIPETICIENKHSKKCNRDFITRELSDLLNNDVIEEVDKKPHCVSPIHSIHQKNGHVRLITDTRAANELCDPPKLSNEDIKEVLNLVKPNDQLVTFDLKNGFFHIMVTASHRTYLGIQLSGKYFQWKCLPLV